jgi:hypothetical protein
MFALFFDPENGGDILLRNVVGLHGVTEHRTYQAVP